MNQTQVLTTGLSSLHQAQEPYLNQSNLQHVHAAAASSFAQLIPTGHDLSEINNNPITNSVNQNNINDFDGIKSLFDLTQGLNLFYMRSFTK
jgi:hypothetical protein